jgi:TPR repeat protein
MFCLFVIVIVSRLILNLICRKAATLNHPGAMYRLGLAEMKGDLGRTTNIRDGHKWLKRSAEASTAEYPHALHELAHLHERGLASLIFQDHAYAVRLYHDASDLFGYAPSCFRLGECYEFGRLGCTVDPRLSMHYYGLAADQGHPHACFALTAWHLIGIPGVMEPSDELAFAWAKRAADDDDQGLPRAAYAVGYFYEVGIGIEKNYPLAWAYYQKAAAQGEKRAVQRLQQEGDQQQQQQQPGLGLVTSTSDSSLPADLSSLSSPSSSLKPSPPQKKASPMNWIKRWKQKLTKSSKP